MIQPSGLQRPGELQQHGLEEHELADRQLAVDHPQAAHQQHQADGPERHQEHGRQVAGLHAGGVDEAVAHERGAAVEARAHGVLAPEGLHHLDADHRLLGRLGDVGLALADRARDRRHAVGEAERKYAISGMPIAGRGRQHGVDPQHQHRGPDDRHRALERCTAPQPTK